MEGSLTCEHVMRRGNEMLMGEICLMWRDVVVLNALRDVGDVIVIGDDVREVFQGGEAILRWDDGRGTIVESMRRRDIGYISQEYIYHKRPHTVLDRVSHSKSKCAQAYVHACVHLFGSRRIKTKQTHRLKNEAP